MSLPPPEKTLRASVVVPARDEEALIGGCLKALAEQRDVTPEEYEVLLVLDRCTDGTESEARKVAGEFPSLRLHFLEGPGEGAGHARRVGMEAACARLISLDRPGGLIASTDADTVVSPDWLSAQLSAAERGARAIGGRIELGESATELPEGVRRWHAEQGRTRHRDVLAEHDEGRAEHWQFSGASLALTAATYQEIGGLEPRAALEDEHLEQTLLQRGIPIERPLSVRVTTSARLQGRARRGLSSDLALASWMERNTLDGAERDVGRLLVSKEQTVGVVIPLLDVDLVRQADALLQSLRPLAEAELLDETIVIGAGVWTSDPQTKVLSGQETMPEYGPVIGYGDLLWRAVAAARSEILVFLDSALTPPGKDAALDLLGPLLESEELRFVKGFRAGGEKAGELCELVARPLINLHTPELAGFFDPLSREFAAHRSLLEKLPFPAGDGAALSLLLDAANLVGIEALAQVDMGATPDSPASATSEVAYAIFAAAASRTPGGEPPNDRAPDSLMLPSSGDLVPRRVALKERPPLDRVFGHTRP